MQSKEVFLTTEFVDLLRKLDGSEKGNWGVLSPQGMIEHMADAFSNAYGKVHLPLHTPEAFLPKARAFVLSDNPFKENTKNALMSPEPAPLRTNSVSEAILELEQEIKAFVDFYKTNPTAIKLNPFFGEFNYEEWLHLLHKHAQHHLKQFNLL